MAGKAKRVRWECPEGMHPAVLGSTRPPKDATVRFCLPCSEASGRLVPRTAPALERQRAQRTVSAQEKRAAAAARERERIARTFVVETTDGETIDLRAEMDRMFRESDELRSRLREGRERASWRPNLIVRRGGKAHVSGHCRWDGEEVVLTCGAGADSHEVREVLMHELCHAVTVWLVPASGRSSRHGRGRDWHGSLYRTVLCRTARELFGVEVHPDDHAEAYGLDRLIQAQMRSKG